MRRGSYGPKAPFSRQGQALHLFVHGDWFNSQAVAQRYRNKESVTMKQFWWLLTMVSVGWYLTVTIYVAIRGAIDIRQMLDRLQSQKNQER